MFVFGRTQLVIADLLQPELLAERLQAAIAQFKLTTPNALLHLLQLTRNIVSLNMFEKAHRTTVNESEHYRQRQSTHVYFLLVLLALFILVVYTSLIYQQNNNTIKTSSLREFRNLQNLQVLLHS